MSPMSDIGKLAERFSRATESFSPAPAQSPGNGTPLRPGLGVPRCAFRYQQTLNQKLAHHLSQARRHRPIKPPLSLKLIRQPRRKPNPKLNLPHVRLTRQTLRFHTRNPRLRLRTTVWHLSHLQT
jgi:hypothetical protein